MTEIISEYNEEYEAFIASHPKGHFCQSRKWGCVKSCWTWKGIICRGEDGYIKGVMSLLIRPLPVLRYRLIYAPRGPVCDTNDEEVLTQLLQAVDLLAKEYRAYRFIIDPDIEECRPFTTLMLKWGTCLKPPVEDFSNIQPQYVVRLNLFGKTPEQIMAAMNQKTRYNIRLAI